MLDFPLMLQVKLPVVDWIEPQSNKFATGDLNLNDSPSNHDNPVSRNHQAPSHWISQWKKLKAYLINAYLEGLGSDGSERLLPIFIASD